MKSNWQGSARYLFVAAIGLMIANSLLAACEDTSKKALEQYLSNYFGTAGFEVWEEKLRLSKLSLTTAVHYVNKDSRIVDRALVFEMNDGIVKPYIYLEGETILDSKRRKIMEISSPYRFYGWQVTYSYPTNPNYQPGFNLTHISDDGKRIADSPSIRWNPVSGNFEEES